MTSEIHAHTTDYQEGDRFCSFCINFGFTCWLLEQVKLHEGKLYHLSPSQIQVCTQIDSFMSENPELDPTVLATIQEMQSPSTPSNPLNQQPARTATSPTRFPEVTSHQPATKSVFTLPTRPLTEATETTKKTSPLTKERKQPRSQRVRQQKETAPLSSELEKYLIKTRVPKKSWDVFQNIVSGTKQEAWKKLIEFGKDAEEISHPVDMQARLFSREFKNQAALFFTMLQYLVETHTELTLEEYFEQYPARNNHLVIPD